jgi:hypothetical protein
LEPEYLKIRCCSGGAKSSLAVVGNENSYISLPVFGESGLEKRPHPHEIVHHKYSDCVFEKQE